MADGQADDPLGPGALLVVQEPLAGAAGRCPAAQDLRADGDRVRVRGLRAGRQEFARGGVVPAVWREDPCTHHVARLDRGHGIVGARFRARRGARHRAIWCTAGGDPPALGRRGRGHTLVATRFRRPLSLSVRGATRATGRCYAGARHRHCDRRAQSGSTALLLVLSRPGTHLRTVVAGFVPHRTFVHAV